MVLRSSVNLGPGTFSSILFPTVSPSRLFASLRSSFPFLLLLHLEMWGMLKLPCGFGLSLTVARTFAAGVHIHVVGVVSFRGLTY